MNYQICNQCVMDTTDPDIVFDDQGVCNHCHHFEEVTKKNWYPNKEGEQKLKQLIEKIKDEGKKHKYDCIIGLSGGVDSSYLSLIMKEYKLRPLVVHVDAGWNSELAVYNIEQIVKYCGWDLHTHVVDWHEVQDLQLAYLKSGVSNQDVVQDHIFFASLYHFATKHNIKHVLSGGNIATEAVFPKAWHHSAMDAINLHAIHRTFGQRKLKYYKTINFLSYFLYYPFIKGMTVTRPLNYMPYDKTEALAYLKKTIGYKEYGRKHGESRFTKFFQNYYLPKKFNMDKRRPHLSSQILSGQITREEALAELDKPLYIESELQEDKEYIAKKLGISTSELSHFINSPGVSYSKYKNWDTLYQLLCKVRVFFEKRLGRSVKNYS